MNAGPRRLIALIVAAWALVCPAAALRAPAVEWSPPRAGALAWVIADPGDDPLARRTVALFGSILADAIGRAAPRDGVAVAWLVRLAAGLDGSRRITLLAPTEGPGPEAARPSAVLEWRAEAAAIEALTVDLQRQAADVRVEALPDGQRLHAGKVQAAGMAFSVVWWSADGTLLVGVGDGVRDAPEAPAGTADAAEWDHHAAAANVDEPILSAFADVNRLRRALPEAATDDGWLSRLLSAWNVENARGLGVHLRREPGVHGRLSLVATWSARSLPPGTVGHGVLGRFALADEAAPDGGQTVAAEGIDWARVFVAGAAARRATLEGWPAYEYAARLAGWQRRHGQRLRRLLDALGEPAIRGESLRAPLPPALAGAARESLAAMLGDVRSATLDERTGAWRLEIGDDAAAVGLPPRLFVRIAEDDNGVALIVETRPQRGGEPPAEGAAE